MVVEEAKRLRSEEAHRVAVEEAIRKRLGEAHRMVTNETKRLRLETEAAQLPASEVERRGHHQQAAVNEEECQRRGLRTTPAERRAARRRAVEAAERAVHAMRSRAGELERWLLISEGQLAAPEGLACGSSSLAREVLDRLRAAAPALMALFAGEAPSHCHQLRRNAALHAEVPEDV